MELVRSGGKKGGDTRLDELLEKIHKELDIRWLRARSTFFQNTADAKDNAERHAAAHDYIVRLFNIACELLVLPVGAHQGDAQHFEDSVLPMITGEVRREAKALGLVEHPKREDDERLVLTLASRRAYWVVFAREREARLRKRKTESARDPGQEFRAWMAHNFPGNITQQSEAAAHTLGVNTKDVQLLRAAKALAKKSSSLQKIERVAAKTGIAASTIDSLYESRKSESLSGNASKGRRQPERLLPVEDSAIKPH